MLLSSTATRIPTRWSLMFFCVWMVFSVCCTMAADSPGLQNDKEMTLPDVVIEGENKLELSREVLERKIEVMDKKESFSDPGSVFNENKINPLPFYIWFKGGYGLHSGRYADLILGKEGGVVDFRSRCQYEASEGYRDAPDGIDKIDSLLNTIFRFNRDINLAVNGDFCWEYLELPGPVGLEFSDRNRKNSSYTVAPELNIGISDIRMKLFGKAEYSYVDDSVGDIFRFREQKIGMGFLVDPWDVGFEISRRYLVGSYFQNTKRIYFRAEGIPIRENIDWTVGGGVGYYQGGHVEGDLDFLLKYKYSHRTDFLVGIKREVELVDFKETYFSRNYIYVNTDRFCPNAIWRLYFELSHLFVRKIRVSILPYVRFEKDPVFWDYRDASGMVIPIQFGAVFFKGVRFFADIEIVDNIHLRIDNRIEEYDTRDPNIDRIPYVSRYESLISLSADWQKAFFFTTTVQFCGNQPDDVNSGTFISSKVQVNAEFSYRLQRNFRIFVRGENLSNDDSSYVKNYPSPPLNFFGGIELKY